MYLMMVRSFVPRLRRCLDLSQKFVLRYLVRGAEGGLWITSVQGLDKELQARVSIKNVARGPVLRRHM
jgi:hypothetical protein